MLSIQELSCSIGGFDGPSKTRFFACACIAMEDTPFDRFVNFADSEGHPFLNDGHLFRRWFSSVGLSRVKILFHQRLDSGFVGLISQTIAFCDLNTFDRRFNISHSWYSAIYDTT
jgi:hypothetical protein